MIRLALLCILSAIPFRSALAAEYYVAPGGSDSNPGTAELPFATLQKAADTVGPGDVVRARAGSYAGFDMSSDHSGTESQPITFTGEPGAVVDRPNQRTQDGINLEGPSYVIIQGFTVRGVPRAGIRTVTNHHVTIRDNVCEENGVWGILTGFSDDVLIERNRLSGSRREHGIYVSNSSVRPIVRANISHGNCGCGLHMNGDASLGGTGLITGALVEKNIFYENGKAANCSGGSPGGSALNADGVQDSIFRNNLIYDNHASGISLYRIDGADGSRNNLVVNNTVMMPSDGRWALNIGFASGGNRVFNNILLNEHSFRGSIYIESESLAGFVSDDNLVTDRFSISEIQHDLEEWRAASGGESRSRVASASEIFTSREGDDYTQRSGSPSVDGGRAESAPQDDLESRPRPQGGGIDIGAYERAEGSPTAPPGATPTPGPTSTPPPTLSATPTPTPTVTQPPRGKKRCALKKTKKARRRCLRRIRANRR